MLSLPRWGTARLPWVAAVAVPLLYVLTVHRAVLTIPSGYELVGLLHVDQPAYYACAREPFDSGGGILYASPYSSRADAPAIYTHFVFLLVGFLWRASGLSLYVLDQSLRLVFGVSMLVLAVATFRRAFPREARDGRLVAAGGVALTVCGGVAWASALWNHLFDYLLLRWQETPDLLPFSLWMRRYPEAISTAEGGYGEWGASLMRVLDSAPECMYHTLFFASTLFLVTGRWMAALLFFGLACWSHPFTGLELSALVCVFLTVEVWMRSRGAAAALAGGLLITALFIAWYLLWLPRFPEHASVEAQMRGFGNPMLIGKMLPAYGLFLPLAAGYLLTRDFRRGWREERGVRLMATWLVSVLLLIFHDRLAFLIRPVQAMHFTRGYLYVPLVYFAVRGLRIWLPALADRWRRTSAVPMAAFLLVLVHFPDNLIALQRSSQQLVPMESPFCVPEETLRLLDELKRIPGQLSIHPIGEADTGGLRQLLPVLTAHRTLLPHVFNTPFHAEKTADVEQFACTWSPDLLTRWGVDAVLADERRAEVLLRHMPDAETSAVLSVRNYRLVFLPKGKSMGQRQSGSSRRSRTSGLH